MTARRRAGAKRPKPEPPRTAPAPRAISVRAYARLRGVSHTAVLKAIRERRIRTLPNGQIDPVAADIAWAGRTDPSKPLNSVCGNPKHRRPHGGPPTPVRRRKPRAPGAPMEGEGASSGSPAGAAVEVPLEESRYIKARGSREETNARRDWLRLEQEEGRLMETAKAHRALATLLRQARDSVLKWPYSVGPELASATGADVRLIVPVLVRVTRELVRELGTKTLPGMPPLEPPPDAPETTPPPPPAKSGKAS